MKEDLTFAFYQLLKSRGVAFIAAGLVFPACKQFSVFSLQFSWLGCCIVFCILLAIEPDCIPGPDVVNGNWPLHAIAIVTVTPPITRL